MHTAAWLASWDEASNSVYFGRTLQIDHDNFEAIAVHWIPDPSFSASHIRADTSIMTLIECPGCSLNDPTLRHTKLLRRKDSSNFNCRSMMNLILSHHISEGPARVKNAVAHFAQQAHYFSSLLEYHFISLNIIPTHIQPAPLGLPIVPINPEYANDSNLVSHLSAIYRSRSIMNVLLPLSSFLHEGSSSSWIYYTDGAFSRTHNVLTPHNN